MNKKHYSRKELFEACENMQHYGGSFVENLGCHFQGMVYTENKKYIQ